MVRSIRSLSLLMAGIVIAAAFAHPARGETLRLKDCIEQAYANNPMLHSVREKQLGATARIGVARSSGSLKLNFTETFMSTNNPTFSFMSVLNQRAFTPAMMGTINNPPNTTNFNSKLTIMQPLYSGGMIPAAVRASRAGREATDYEVTRTMQVVRYNVKVAYLRIIIAEKNLDVVDQALATAKAFEKMTEDMLKNGVVVESDTLSAQVRVATLEEMRLTVENQVQLSKAGLLMAMGADQARNVDVDPGELENVSFEGTIEEYIAKAMVNRPDLLAMERGIAAKTQVVKMARAERRPQLAIMANYDLDNSKFYGHDGQSWFVGVPLSVSVFDGGVTKHKIADARAGLEELRWQSETLRQGIEMEVRQAFLNVQVARKRMDVMQRAAEQANESYRIIENRYKNGLAINVEALAGETARTEAQTHYLTAMFDFIVGVEGLKLAAGVN
jgi:outer membrane protein